MRFDARASDCDVVGCDKPATGSYLDARDSRVLEFGICADHHVRLQKGEQPVVVAERFGPSDFESRPVLILD